MITALLFLATQTAYKDEALGWRCATNFEVDGRRVNMWRDYFPSEEAGVYQLQMASGPHRTSWTINSRVQSNSPKKKLAFRAGRSEADVLAHGPDYVSIGFHWHNEVVGPVWTYYWGDGQYAGVKKLLSARQVKKSTKGDGKMGGISAGLSQGPIMQKLSSAKQWSVVAVDATGKQLYSETFSPPNLTNAKIEYRKARSEIEKLEEQFRKDPRPIRVGDTACYENT